MRRFRFMGIDLKRCEDIEKGFLSLCREKRARMSLWCARLVAVTALRAFRPIYLDEKARGSEKTVNVQTPTGHSRLYRIGLRRYAEVLGEEQRVRSNG